MHYCWYIITSLDINQYLWCGSIFNIKWSWSGLTKEPYKTYSKCCHTVSIMLEEKWRWALLDNLFVKPFLLYPCSLFLGLRQYDSLWITLLWGISPYTQKETLNKTDLTPIIQWTGFCGASERQFSDLP